MATRLQHGDSLYQVIEKVNEIIDGTVQPGSGGSGGGSSSSTNVTTSMLEAETDRATSAEQYLQDQIDIINNLIGAGDGDEADSNTGEDNELQAAIIMESIHAATREHNNAQSIAAEVTRAQAAEQTLQTNIDDEVTRAQTAEQTLQTNIDDEATRATTAEQNLQNQIDNEVTRAQQAEQTLQTNIDDETTRATTAEQNLQDQIDAITDGTVYNATVVQGFTLSRARYCVINGLCYVEIWGLVNTDTSGNQVAFLTGLPKAKLSSSVQFNGNMIYAWAGDTRIILEGHVASSIYTSIIYPVDYS